MRGNSDVLIPEIFAVSSDSLSPMELVAEASSSRIRLKVFIPSDPIPWIRSRTMTLNPSAEVFIPSSQTLRLLKGTSSPAVDPVKPSITPEFSPPQLESLYIDLSGSREDEEIFNGETQPVSATTDYTNFDVSSKKSSISFSDS